MVSGIRGIGYNISKANRTDGRVQNLAAHIDKDALRAIHRKMKAHKASGIDKVTKEEYGANLEENLDNLISRMKGGEYRPNPTRRVYIPKSGSKKMRPLGISCYEDKLVENAVAQMLIPIYEQKFIATSYGFRPNRGCHMAVREVIEMVQYRKVNYVVEADIRGFFDNVDHEWLMKMLAHDIADRRFLAIIERFLKAGVMENGKYLDREKGTAQGNGASPVLANVYLHYVLDLWFEKRVRNHAKGQCYLIRYADDFICCFQYRNEAELFLTELRDRMRKFGLELAEEKTKILEFGRFAERNRKTRGEEKPETFDFLGFTFFNTTTRTGKYRVGIRSSAKKMKAKRQAVKEWLRGRLTKPIAETMTKLHKKVEGHYNYYGISGNLREINKFTWYVWHTAYRMFNRRDQKGKMKIDCFKRIWNYYMGKPSIRVDIWGWNQMVA